jgi:hypothetical protein
MKRDAKQDFDRTTDQPVVSDVSRRHFLRQTALSGAVLAGGSVWSGGTQRAEGALKTESDRATADSCIFIWLGGGACQIDTFDPKRRSTGRKDPGSYYDSIPTAVSGVSVCEHLERLAPLLDRCILLRSVHHDVIDEHAAATNRMHTGRPPTGTTMYPSIGSVCAHELGARGEGVPPYVLIGYPSASRGPGFLGATAGYLYLTDTESGPAGLQRPPSVSWGRQQRREALAAAVRGDVERRLGGDGRVADYLATSRAGAKLAGPDFLKAFDLESESESLRQVYGSEFGQRCLLSRRLVQEGVRFVEVSYNLNFINGTGWDTHNEGQQKQHLLIQDLDQALSALITDLERVGRLDKTLIVVATEFGRPPEFDGGGGRGHQSRAFSVVLAGGGLKTGQAVGVTDELGKSVLERPISVPDLHATIYETMGVDPEKELYDGDRPVPITDYGRAVSECFVNPL